MTEQTQPETSVSQPPSDPLERLGLLCRKEGANIKVMVTTAQGARIRGMEAIPGDAFDPSTLDLPPGEYRFRPMTADGRFIAGSATYRVVDSVRGLGADSLPAHGIGIQSEVIDAINQLRKEFAELKSRNGGTLDGSMVQILTLIREVVALTKPIESLTIRDLLPFIKQDRHQSDVTTLITALRELDELRGPAAPASEEAELLRAFSPLISAAIQNPANPRADDPAFRRPPKPLHHAAARPPKDQTPTDGSSRSASGGVVIRALQPARDDAIGRLAVIIGQCAMMKQPVEPVAAFTMAMIESGELLEAIKSRGLTVPEPTEFADPIIELIASAEPTLLGQNRDYLNRVATAVVDLLRDEQEESDSDEETDDESISEATPAGEPKDT